VLKVGFALQIGAIAWGLIDDNPAKRGVPNPLRRYKGEPADRVLVTARSGRQTARAAAKVRIGL
jgi:hypothetical protein